MLKTNDGFTLLESLFVLSIFTLIVTLSILLVRPQMSLLDKHLFFSQFKEDLYYAQTYAISHKTIVNVNILPYSHRYYAKDPLGNVVFDRTFSKSVTIREGSQNLYFRYNTNGNINTFGTLYINIHGKKYIFTFHIGKGRFYVKQI